MKNFLAVFNLFPSILTAVQAVEAAIPFPGAGKQKLDLILSAVGGAWDTTQSDPQMPKNSILSAVETLVSLVVAGLNAAGVFKKIALVSSK